MDKPTTDKQVEAIGRIARLCHAGRIDADEAQRRAAAVIPENGRLLLHLLLLELQLRDAGAAA